jgi:hypothetical protein
MNRLYANCNGTGDTHHRRTENVDRELERRPWTLYGAITLIAFVWNSGCYSLLCGESTDDTYAILSIALDAPLKSGDLVDIDSSLVAAAIC